MFDGNEVFLLEIPLGGMQVAFTNQRNNITQWSFQNMEVQAKSSESIGLHCALCCERNVRFPVSMSQLFLKVHFPTALVTI